MAKTINDVSRNSWILSTFPEWGTYLNEEIATTKVKAGSFSIWWLGCTGIWLKTHEDTNILCDLWCGTGKQTHGTGKMKAGHQMMRMSGCQNQQPNLRNQPFVIDPFAIKDVDALCVSHIHSDHLDINTAAAVNKNCPEAKFIGPKEVVATWRKWGVPEEKLIVVKPGDEVKVGAVTIKAMEAFDRTALVTESDPEVKLAGKLPQDMDKIAVNYLFETSGGNLYHAADSHYANEFAKHGNENQIDVALGAYGENPRGITDKVTSIDILRMAESLRAKVVIPVHYDIWTNFYADPKEITELWRLRKDRLQYDFKPFIWQVGGKFTYPEDKDRLEFMYDRGFEDVFTKENDVPFPSFL
ncbi:L-ascorbate 6-phosphate lactonase [Ligilactobacillus murinus]|jgi:L-ascorbate 6-phosphate lactonase|uniref:L-ascorbate 6-phosphate lactonase n=1 Tax=Ligilactobacillus murinus TaxID=1622 RepID=A0A4Q2AYG6_9LACO|nr:L-ascorbate 6-phosphate lactonase [Ligilactobacillus murinus]NBH84383.1 L-ascorbate 6-phosphate lactonase [Lachnospiraceae bacterium]MBF0702157.1 L-ascorbate 6-phosphate lactonase [Ligilactobacillus murinus]MCR1880198.1 L-ascorbate 6-phosphate lactonase [Ligilactobacillus murinus]MCR1896903.1 L-ascorbate 6-phosphate lactonase [Ligilactobacillus murinus]MCZ0673447.1 L-ascorbate 6-phosphate lactonase [Ligilactobacillus murinus]